MSDSATLWTVACQAPPSIKFSQQEGWSGLPFPSPGDLPDPAIEHRSPTLQADFYHLSHQGSISWMISLPCLTFSTEIRSLTLLIKSNSRPGLIKALVDLASLTLYLSPHFTVFLALFCLNTLPSNIYTASFLSSFRALFKCDLLHQVFLDHLIQNHTLSLPVL